MRPSRALAKILSFLEGETLVLEKKRKSKKNWAEYHGDGNSEHQNSAEKAQQK